METSTRKNYGNTQRTMGASVTDSGDPRSEITRAEAEPVFESRGEDFLQVAHRMSRVLRWISFRKNKKAAVLVVALVVALGAYGVYEKFFNLSDAERAQKELKAAMSAVSKHMILPEGDEPVLATVTDAEALTKQQAFFVGAVNGDQLLLFSRNLKAILYSPSRNKIVNAGPIEQSPQAAAKSETPNQSSDEDATGQANSNDLNTLTVEVRNGTDKTGYASQFAEELVANAGYTVVEVADAGKKDYQNTVVYVRTGNKSNQSKVDALTTSLGVAATNSLPDGEKTTSADVLVILGLPAEASAQAGGN